MDRTVSERIYSWIGEKLVGCEDPYGPGRKLTGSLSGMVRYRVGDHRIIAEVRDGELIILIIEIEHRKKVYDRS
jgi:mRNA interferase RelE/StbE